MGEHISTESVLDWADLDSLVESAPDDERIHLRRAIYRMKQLRLSKDATKLVPDKMQQYLLPQYGEYGWFKGFICVACSEWLKRHEAFALCPLNELIPDDFNLGVIYELIDSHLSHRDI